MKDRNEKASGRHKIHWQGKLINRRNAKQRQRTVRPIKILPQMPSYLHILQTMIWMKGKQQGLEKTQRSYNLALSI